MTPTQHPSHQQDVSTSGIERVQGNLSRGQAETENPNINDNERVRGNPSRDLPEWLEELRKNLVDDSVPEHRDAPRVLLFRDVSESGVW